MKKPKAPKKSAQEVAVERRQQIMLDKEIEEQEDRFRAMSRGKLGRSSLLAGAPRTRGEAAGRGATAGGRTSMVGGMTGGYGSFGGGGIFGGASGSSGTYARPSSRTATAER